MFYIKVAKILHRDFYFLNKLEKIEKKKHLIKELIIVFFLFAFADIELLDFALAN